MLDSDRGCGFYTIFRTLEGILGQKRDSREYALEGILGQKRDSREYVLQGILGQKRDSREYVLEGILDLKRDSRPKYYNWKGILGDSRGF